MSIPSVKRLTQWKKFEYQSLSDGPRSGGSAIANAFNAERGASKQKTEKLKSKMKELQMIESQLNDSSDKQTL